MGMLNQSVLIGLTLSLSLSRSPFFATPVTSSHTHFNFARLYLSHFTSNFLYSPQARPCGIQSSSFSHFLKSPISVTSVCVTKHLETVHGPHTQVIDNCLNVTNCTFQSCSNPNGNGGAIDVNCTTSYDILVSYTQFTACLSTYDGGALYITVPVSNVDITFNTFSICYTTYRATTTNNTFGGAVFVDSLGALVNLSCNIFTKNMVNGAGSGGAVYVSGSGIDLRYCIFVDCNVTNRTNTATSTGGGMHILCKNNKDPLVAGQIFELHLSFINFTNCNAMNGSAIYIENATDETMTFDTTVFNNCSDTETNQTWSTLAITANQAHAQPVGITIAQMVFDDPRITTASLRRLISGPTQTTGVATPLDMTYLNSQNNVMGTIYCQNAPNFNVTRQFVPNLPLGTGWIVVRPITEFAYGALWPYDPSQAGLPPVPTPIPPSTSATTPIATPTITATPAGSPLSTVAIVFIVIACIVFVFAIIGLVICLCKLESCRRCLNRRYTERVTGVQRQITYF